MSMKADIKMKVRDRKTEAGMMSIIVTMIMMLVITLIVLGFAQISRRDEQQALDNQLSTQAFFAAETGVNDAYDAVRTQLASTGTVQPKSTCGPGSAASPYPASKYDPAIDAGVSYSCLLVTTELQDISQTVATDGSSVTLPLHPVGGPGIKIHRLNITWYAAQKVTPLTLSNCPNNAPAMGAGSLKPATSWTCPYSMLRIDLVPTDTATLSRGSLMMDNIGFFLYPALNAGPISSNSANGTVQGMKCGLASCTAAIDITPQTYTNYSIRLSAIYQSGGTVDIKADGPSGPLDLADAQVAIDSTGKAQDVLRRIQARMSLVQPNNSVGYALETGSSICKHFQVANGIGINNVTGQDSNNPYCNDLAMP